MMTDGQTVLIHMIHTVIAIGRKNGIKVNCNGESHHINNETIINRNQIGVNKWLDIQETMVDQEATVGLDQITAEDMEGQATAAVGRDINETVDLARGQKMDIRNTIMVMDGSLRIGE